MFSPLLRGTLPRNISMHFFEVPDRRIKQIPAHSTILSSPTLYGEYAPHFVAQGLMNPIHQKRHNFDGDGDTYGVYGRTNVSPD